MVCGMTAASTPIPSGMSATAASRLNVDLFDQLTRELGAEDDSARARLLDVDRATIFRWRKGRYAPRHEVATRIARKLGTTVDELFPAVAA